MLKEPELLENKDYNNYSRYIARELDHDKEQEIRSKAYTNEELLVVQESHRLPFNSKALANSHLQKKVNNYRHRTIHSQDFTASVAPLESSYGDMDKR